MTTDEIITAIEARQLHLSHIMFSPNKRQWEVYARQGQNREQRAWEPAKSFREAVERLILE